MMGRVHRCRVAISGLLVALLLDLTGCSAWQQVEWQDNYTQVRAHLADGGVVTLRDPSLVRDTLYGWRAAPPRTSTGMPEIYGRPQAQTSPQPQGSDMKHAGYDSTAIPLAQISKLEAQKPDPGSTGFVVIGVVLAAATLLVLFVRSGTP